MIKIGDFARLCQVTVPTLRHYDEVGLLIPITVDNPSGYRYYSVSQMPRLNRILVLKDLGLSLLQIESVLNGGLTPDELRGMLKRKHAEVEQLENFRQLHTALLQWIEANGYQVAGAYREIYINHRPEDMANSVTEIQYPLSKIN